MYILTVLQAKLAYGDYRLNADSVTPQASIKGKMSTTRKRCRRVAYNAVADAAYFSRYVPYVEKKQADCPFEERRRMFILQAPIEGKMRRLFFTSCPCVTCDVVNTFLHIHAVAAGRKLIAYIFR